MQTDLPTIITGCLDGKRFYQEKLYRLYYNYGISIALHYTSGLSEAEMIYNDTMLKVILNIKQFNGESGAFKGWVRRILVNSAIDFNRKYCKVELLPETEISDDLLTQPINSNLEVNDILKMIQRIPPSYRTVFNLHAIEGYKFTEIATQLNITESGAKSLYAKAKIKLQELISKEEFLTR